MTEYIPKKYRPTKTSTTIKPYGPYAKSFKYEFEIEDGWKYYFHLYYDLSDKYFLKDALKFTIGYKNLKEKTSKDWWYDAGKSHTEFFPANDIIKFLEETIVEIKKMKGQ